MKFTLQRDVFEGEFTLGELLQEGEHFAFTCEDVDRKLEDGNIKVPGKSAIPRGTYPLTVSMSARFSRLMPLVKDVPNFSGVRIHGGNTHKDTEGCPLIGEKRTAEGVAVCAAVVAKLIKIIVEAETGGDKCYLEVK